MLEVVIFTGLPASGKTTFYRERFAPTHRHVSKDNWPNARRKEQRQAEEIRAALAAGVPVVVDNTNPAVVDRLSVIEVAREFGARVIGYYFDASTRDAVGRNRGRQGKARVPDVAIFTKAKRMVVPTRGEGYDDLYRVSIGPGGGVQVREEP